METGHCLEHPSSRHSGLVHRLFGGHDPESRNFHAPESRRLAYLDSRVRGNDMGTDKNILGQAVKDNILYYDPMDGTYGIQGKSLEWGIEGYFEETDGRMH